jgi:hypothetical protein
LPAALAVCSVEKPSSRTRAGSGSPSRQISQPQGLGLLGLPRALTSSVYRCASDIAGTSLHAGCQVPLLCESGRGLWGQRGLSLNAAPTRGGMKTIAPIRFSPGCSKLHRLAEPSRDSLTADVVGRGAARVAMNDAQRYRENAAECLSAAERRGSPYRTLSFRMAAWLSLARQEEAVDGMRGNASEPAAAAGRARSGAINLA